MADEIQVRARLTYSKATAGSGGHEYTGSFTFTGTKVWSGLQNVGTSEEALVLGDTTAAGGGWLLIKNLDATNYVEIKSATGVTALIRLKAGEFALFRRSASSTAPFVQANTSAVNIEVTMLDD